MNFILLSMQNKTCIVSVAFRNPYVQHMDKLVEFIKNDAQPVDMLFFKDELPSKDGIIKEDIVTHFQKSLYGFKPHAIQQAIEMGYEKIIWLDPSILPTVSLKVLIDALDEHPMVVRTGDAPITKMTNARVKKWFDVTDADLEGVKHIGGTIYCFNFNNLKTREVFDLWRLAEIEGMFGDQDEFMKGDCWADESAMVLSLHKIGVLQYWEEKFTYYNMKNGI